jgi:hypothetical protein
MILGRAPLSAAIALLAGAVPARGQAPAAAPVTADWVQRWRDDLHFVAETLPRVHANLFHTITPARFQAALDSLAARVPTLTHAQATVELARVIALIGDGHTRLTLPFDSAAAFFTGHSTTAPPKIPGLAFGHLPLRFHAFADGIFVTRASPEMANLLGARVVRLGRMSIEDAVAAIAPTVQRDNAMQLRNLVPTWLVVPEILEARGVIADATRVPIEVELPDGTRRKVTLRPAPSGQAIAWRDARSGAPPLSQQRPTRRHWFTQIEGTRTVYARYAEVLDDSTETIARFAADLMRHVRDSGIERLVLDIRGNPGGNGTLNRPLIQAIIRAESLWRPGGLVVLIDRGSFSAAVMLAVALEAETPAILVGEPTGGAPNGYGDSRRVRLPNTGLTIRASTLYWQLSDPRDARDAVTPHVTVTPRSADYRAGRDVALDTALALVGAPADPAGHWAGTVGFAWERLPVTLVLAPSGTAWTGRISVPDADVVDQALGGIVAGDAEVTFPLAIWGDSATVHLRASAHTLVGTVDLAGSVYPIVLRR